MAAAMVPPGQHFFYFVRDQGRIFLSPRYDIVRFKSTNIFLNRVVVKRRNEDIQTVHLARAGDEDEAMFSKERSIFRSYVDETEREY